ncbi:efflux RND transporter periplasmic adaptor subunit [Caulobacter sp. NIBR1757]|uniref:efflux RND transporter periplasmic adaptor subunit n=1 Tax=Caulobacter sp. NIBR1757 TaxID=3016000 RepID=UPI0022F0B3E7|nr:efflux RND transporter periplasmic adaptor subunit [Caulobacter sp. NIBR1757]
MTFALVLALPLAACGKTEEAPKAKVAQTVTAAVVSEQTLPRRIEVSGTVTAWNEVIVGAETGGLTAVQVLADEGDWVRQGQLIVKMSDTVQRAALSQAQAGVLSAKATLAEATAALGRSQELKAKGYLSQAALDTALARQRTASAGVAQAEAAAASAAAQLDQTNLRAPVSGRVSSRAVVKGQIVQPGVELFRLVRDGRLELAGEVPEAQLTLLRPGMPATITGDEGGQTGGVVRLITPRVDAQTRVGLARVSLASPQSFRPGMFAKASIDVGDQPALVLPQSSVVFRNSKAGVYVVDAGNVAHFREVTTGARVGESVEIAAGLNAGERVVVGGAGFLADGDHVRVVTAQPKR